MKTFNGVEIEWIDGNAYIRLKEYERLLEEYKELKEKAGKKDGIGIE